MYIQLNLILQSLYVISSKSVNYDDLKNILTKSDSKAWLRNLQNETFTKYCELCCISIGSETVGKNCGAHTMCLYPNNRTGPACRGYIPINFSLMEKQVLLDAHNTIRNKVASGEEHRGDSGPQPTAANMRMMEWDHELAYVAARWAAQCIYSHDICRDLERFPVGQNIAQGNVATNNELSFIKEWYDEVQLQQGSEIANFKLTKGETHVAGRYTQLVWGDTYLIGCARAVFQQSKNSHVSYREHLICNYGPTGNIPNQPVYLVGKPCSACQEGTSCTHLYPSLCSGHPVSKISEEIFKEDPVTAPDNSSVKIKAQCCNLVLLLFFIYYNTLFL